MTGSRELPDDSWSSQVWPGVGADLGAAPLPGDALFDLPVRPDATSPTYEPPGAVGTETATPARRPDPTAPLPKAAPRAPAPPPAAPRPAPPATAPGAPPTAASPAPAPGTNPAPAQAPPAPPPTAPPGRWPLPVPPTVPGYPGYPGSQRPPGPALPRAARPNRSPVRRLVTAGILGVIALNAFGVLSRGGSSTEGTSGAGVSGDPRGADGVAGMVVDAGRPADAHQVSLQVVGGDGDVTPVSGDAVAQTSSPGSATFTFDLSTDSSASVSYVSTGDAVCTVLLDGEVFAHLDDVGELTCSYDASP